MDDGVDIVQICSNFMKSAPPGELPEVVHDVKTLVEDPAILDDAMPAVFREYANAQMVQVESPGHSHKVLLTTFGEISDGEYLDPAGGQVISYNHLSQKVTSSRPISGELDSSLEPLRGAFEKHAFEYAAAHFPHGTATVYGFQGEIVLCISAARFNPNNYWNGRWRSTWSYRPGSAKATGLFKVVVHYYEDGNVQLNTDTSVSVTFQDGSNHDTTAKNAVAAILKSEQTFQQSLETSYQTMGDTTFKALRRALPITRNKIDWNKIKTYKVSSDIGPK